MIWFNVQCIALVNSFRVFHPNPILHVESHVSSSISLLAFVQSRLHLLYKQVSVRTLLHTCFIEKNWIDWFLMIAFMRQPTSWGGLDYRIHDEPGSKTHLWNIPRWNIQQTSNLSNFRIFHSRSSKNIRKKIRYIIVAVFSYRFVGEIFHSCTNNTSVAYSTSKSVGYSIVVQKLHLWNI